MSEYGAWTTIAGLPAFAYSRDHLSFPGAVWDTRNVGKTHRHWVGIGNRRIQAFVDNDGTAALYDEHFGARWLTAFEPAGTGVSWVQVAGRARWGSRYTRRPSGAIPQRTFGPTWFRIECAGDSVELERTLLCAEGEQPWVLIRVRLTSRATTALQLKHVEEWAVSPRFMNLGVAPALTLQDQARARQNAERHVAFRVESAAGVLRALEQRQGDLDVAVTGGAESDSVRVPFIFGPAVTMILQALGETAAQPTHDGQPHPTLRLSTDLDLAAGECKTLWFRFGIDDGGATADPQALYEGSLQRLAARLPVARSARAPMAEREIPWHTALLTGGACADSVLGGHTLDQSSAYLFMLGFNGAARDPLQHALPLIYSEPDLALSVLRNTASWGAPNGKIPWCIDGAKQVRPGAAMGPMSLYQRASDLGMWALWLAAEYAAATGDLQAFRQPLAFHPSHRAAPVSLHEHLCGHFTYLTGDGVGFGAHGHLRVLDCDWADGHLGEIQKHGLDKPTIIAEGESVLNSAMAAWVLPVWAGLCDRLGDSATAAQAREVAERLRQLVAQEWNGRWFRRARCRDAAVGDQTLFLEVQPWAILCGAADSARAKALLATIGQTLRHNSPLGARQRWPVPTQGMASGSPGEALSGGIWPSLQMVLIWAAARHDPELAWDEWRRMTLANHTANYPAVWEGTISGPDSYNAPESETPGRSWALASFGMQQFPANNLHVHAQPIISYLRLLGVEPLADGALRVAGGAGMFRSRTFAIAEDGSGELSALGPVVVRSRSGDVRGERGAIRWP